MKITLEKEPDNEYDKEAIQVKMKGMGKIGYVANSPYTIIGDSMSAGRIYDRIEDKAKAKVVMVTEEKILEALRQIEEKDYTAKLKQDGMINFIKYGIACYKKFSKVVIGE